MLLIWGPIAHIMISLQCLESLPAYLRFVREILRSPLDSPNSVPLMMSVEVYSHVRINRQLDKHSSCRWLKTPWVFAASHVVIFVAIKLWIYFKNIIVDADLNRWYQMHRQMQCCLILERVLAQNRHLKFGYGIIHQKYDGIMIISGDNHFRLSNR